MPVYISEQIAGYCLYFTANLLEARIVQRATQYWILFNKQYFRTILSGFKSRTHTRWPTAYYGDIGKPILFVRVVALRPQIYLTETRHTPDNGLPVAPGPSRFIKRFIVKTNGQKTTEELGDATIIVFQITYYILSGYDHPFFNCSGISANAWFITDLYQGVAILTGHAQDSTRTMILERTRNQLDGISCQRTGDRVAFISFVSLTFKLEGDGFISLKIQTIWIFQSHTFSR